MIKAGHAAGKIQRLLRGIQQLDGPQRIGLVQLSDTGERELQVLGEIGDACSGMGWRTKQQFVIITATQEALLPEVGCDAGWGRWQLRCV